MHPARALALSLALSGLAASGCRRPTPSDAAPSTSAPAPSGAAPVASASASPAASPSPSSSPSARAPLAPSPSASAPPSAEELAAIKRYTAALGKGRLLTTRGEFPEAIKAFDEALSAIPNDARALAERGYAKLHGDDVEGAERDFYDAIARTSDPKALSQITHNLAEVADRRGQGELAGELLAAAKAQRRVTRPASSSCSYQVRRGKSIDDYTPPLKLTSLLEVRTKIAASAAPSTSGLPAAVFATEEGEALKKLLVGDGPPPWVIRDGGKQHLLTGSPGDYRLRLAVAEPWSARCGRSQSVRLDLQPLPSVSSFYWDAGFGLSCSKPEPGQPEHCQPACPGPPWNEQVTTVYDAKTLAPLLQIRQGQQGASEEAPPTLAMVVTEGGVQILGGSCKAFEAFTK